ncbi:hypothetical protein DACRYDRAFT_116117 [Dacryopinax primogenitus]|uniref:Uncharacterized protein n=1 Tax=Dacryopinax primogenitus (strain DJM 731) TaxID=1858805 RepID=M5FWT8_DACPD|nr:uncharacterized protein DACRYDRAFT_116117 [Dacryopinax primogenitus]EJU02431.1 hypothetical protein DACRYDRAFT_116117 [Dacryopinax primogenitus]
MATMEDNHLYIQALTWDGGSFRICGYENTREGGDDGRAVVNGDGTAQWDYLHSTGDDISTIGAVVLLDLANLGSKYRLYVEKLKAFKSGTEKTAEDILIAFLDELKSVGLLSASGQVLMDEVKAEADRRRFAKSKDIVRSEHFVG